MLYPEYLQTAGVPQGKSEMLFIRKPLTVHLLVFPIQHAWPRPLPHFLLRSTSKPQLPENQGINDWTSIWFMTVETLTVIKYSSHSEIEHSYVIFKKSTHNVSWLSKTIYNG